MILTYYRGDVSPSPSEQGRFCVALLTVLLRQSCSCRIPLLRTELVRARREREEERGTREETQKPRKKCENSQKTHPFASLPHAFLENPLTQTRFPKPTQPSNGNPVSLSHASRLPFSSSPTRAWTSHNGHLQL